MSNSPAMQHVLGPIEGYIWPKAMIYTDPQPDSEVPPYVDYHTTRFPIPDYFTPQYLAEITRETSWVRALQPKPVPANIEEAVGRGTMPCPYCGGSGTASCFHVGVNTKMYVRRPVPCTCRVSKLFWGFWQQVPERFQAADLDTITPCGDLKVSTERQAAAIQRLKDRPEDSDLLIGQPDSGKTFLGYSLLRRAARNWAQDQVLRGTMDRSIWVVQVPKYLRDLNEWHTRRSEEYGPARPDLMPETVDRRAAKGLRVVLMTDEMDKFRPTDARLENLEEITDAVYRHKGQLIATCNDTRAELYSTWGEKMAGSILRRFSEGEGAQVIEYART